MIANPWMILGVLLAFLAVGGGGYGYGHHNGVNAQKVAGQGMVDKVNDDLAAQKTEAAILLKKSNDRLLQTLADRDAVKAQLENTHVANQAATTALRNQYAALGLRFRTQGAGCGGSGGNSVPEASAPASDTTTTDIQLPDSITRNLRQLAEACDSLKDDYKLLYDWAHTPVGNTSP